MYLQYNLPTLPSDSRHEALSVLSATGVPLNIYQLDGSRCPSPDPYNRPRAPHPLGPWIISPLALLLTSTLIKLTYQTHSPFHRLLLQSTICLSLPLGLCLTDQALCCLFILLYSHTIKRSNSHHFLGLFFYGISCLTIYYSRPCSLSREQA